MSVDAVQLRFINAADDAVALNAPGAVGAVVSLLKRSFGIDLLDDAVHPCIISTAITTKKKTTATHNLGRGRMIRTAALRMFVLLTVQRLSKGGRAGDRHLFGTIKNSTKNVSCNVEFGPPGP